jgi:inward rectifier potassium channel
MAFLRRKTINKEFGFGTTDTRQKRLINPDGSYNFRRIGLPFYETFNVYHFLTTTSIPRFGLLIIIWYSTVNLLFVGLFYLIGIKNISGMLYETKWEEFWEVYFFSAQTLTTVGYGRLNPIGFGASALSSIEALVGLLSFALVTGLLYARFAKAPSIVMFSKRAVIAPFMWNGQEILGFMFRAANQYNTNLMNMKAQISLSLLETNDNGEQTRKFYPLSLERDMVTFFPSSWTIVHPIAQESPLYGYTYEAFEAARPEFLILLNGFDETFDQNVFARYSYSVEEIEWGAKFVKIFGFDDEGNATVNLGDINKYEKMEINHLVATASTLELRE